MTTSGKAPFILGAAILATLGIAGHGTAPSAEQPVRTVASPPGSALSDLATLRISKPQYVITYKRTAFGTAWTDDTSAPDGRNGCTTDLDVYAKQLTDPVLERRGRCDHYVKSGTLHDAYTQKAIPYRRVKGQRAIGIDHVYPLAYAWRMGANGWTPQKRAAFANDTRLNLIATSQPVNASKGDQGPGEWMPPTKAGACTYSARFVAVAKAYSLPITKDDRDSLELTLKECR